MTSFKIHEEEFIESSFKKTAAGFNSDFAAASSFIGKVRDFIASMSATTGKDTITARRSAFSALITV